MPYSLTLPNGFVVNGIPDDVPRSQALDNIRRKMPDAFPAPPGIVQQLIGAPGEIIKGFTRGITVDPLSGIASLGYTGARAAGAELAPFEQTAFGRGLSQAQTYLAPKDEGAITQVAGGLGSLASFIPGALLKGGIKALTLGAQSMGLGSEEARARTEQARLEGKDVSAQQQLLAQTGGAGVGLTELAPVERLAGPLRALFRGIKPDDAARIAPGLANSVQRMAITGGIEGVQEGTATILQDLIQRGVYDPNLPIGQSALGDAALGATVGTIAQGALELATRGRRTQAYEQLKEQERQRQAAADAEKARLEQERQFAETRRNLGVETPLLGLPAPAPKIETEERVDPLMNPVGFVKSEELSPEHLKYINDVRKQEGKKPLNQFSIEDLADAGAPQQELDRILAFKTGYDGRTQLSSQDVLNIAQEKKVDTSTVGFLDFLRRTTGSEDLTTMSQPQLFSAFKAIDGLSPAEATQILPPGTNATRFSEDQYNKAMTGLASEIPKNNMMSRDQAIESIKQYTGLETDRDAESLLQTAIRSGDYTTVNRTVYELVIPGDPTSPPARRYTSREAAEKAAQRLGLEVRERTHQDIALPGKATQLPGGPDIRQGTFKEGVAPAGFEIRSPDAVLQTAATQEEADAKADRLQQLRAQKANGYLGEIAKKNELMQKSQRKLESMEADGKANTLEYKKIAAGVAAQNKRLQNEIDALKAKVQSYTAPLEIAAKGQKPVTRTGFTLFEQNQPVATFPNQQAAEEAAIARLPDETLQNIVKLAPSQKGLMPKRLGKMAEAELRRRRGEEPAGFGVEITGTRAEAEARLAAAGVFTPEFQKAAAELEKKLRPLMDRLGLKDLRLNIMRTIKTKDGKSADGYYLQRLIAIAMDADNPMRTLRHEGIHALKELGAFTPQQWKTLEDRARSEWMSKYDIANRYKGMGLTQDEMLEEAISDAFSDFDQTKAPAGLIGALFNKIKQFMQAFGNGMRGLGFQTAEDVFQTVEAGGLKPATVGRTTIRPGGEARPEPARREAERDPRWNDVDRLEAEIKSRIRAMESAPEFTLEQVAEDRRLMAEIAQLQSQRDALISQIGTPEGQLPKYARKSKKFEKTSDLTPLTVEKAKFQEDELEALIKKIGDRIVGMKSGETLDNVRQAVEKLQSYTAQGLKGRKWYEQSAKAVLDAFNGDPILAEKFFQIIAITSAKTEVAANFTKTTKAWTQFAQGKPIKVGTENENKKIEALLNFGEDWDGRKTNTFYTSLMEAMDGKDSGRSTIDLHMTRMLFDKDAPTDAQYELAENMVRLLASKLNVPARQVQAASWVTQKAKTIFEEYRKKGWKKDLNDLELRQFAFERAAADYSHLMKAKVSALPVTNAMKELSSSIRNRVQTITGEVIPSVQSEMSQVEEIEFDAKDKLTKTIAKQNFIPNIAEALNLTSKVRVTVGSGAYQSKVNPNLIVQLVNPDPDLLKKEALDLANAMSYVFKQDATPFFRADPALVDTGQLGFRLRFDTKALTPAQQRKILNLLNGKFGADAGFTRVRGNEIVLINFRGEDGQPFLTSDTEFVNGLSELRPQIENIAKLEEVTGFGAESEYPYHDWKSDPVGTGIVQGIYSRGPQRPDLQGRLDNIRESFTERARDAVADTGRDPKFSLKSTEPVVRPSTEGDGISLGERQPGAMTFDGVHYSNTADIPTLFGRRYGSGIRGAEAKRLQYADPRIKNRVYFYIPRENGVMPIPEAGLGGHVYIQRLNNMLGPGPEMSRINREAMGDPNNFESGVVDAGYDGYAVPSMGMMVVLNNDVPVEYRGTRDQIRQKPVEESVQIGDRRYALRQTDTPEFKRWFGDSKVVDEDSKPQVVYHATKNFEGNIFKPSKKVNRVGNPDGYYFTHDIEDANIYAGEEEGSQIIPVYLSIKKPYIYGKNPHNSVMAKEFEKELRADNPRLGDDWIQEKVDVFKEGRFPNIDFPTAAMTRVIKAGGYDGMKDGRDWVAFEPEQIKSAIGNIGTFDVTSPDIRYALRQTQAPEFKKWFGKSTIVDDEGKPKVMYHGTARDITEFRPKQANAIFVTDRPRFAEGFADMSMDYIVRERFNELPDQDKDKVIKSALRLARQNGLITPADAKFAYQTAMTGGNMNRYGIDPQIAQFMQPYMETGQNIMPVFVRAENPFDFEDAEQIQALVQKLNEPKYNRFLKPTEQKYGDRNAEFLESGSWKTIEAERVQDAIKSLGHDGFYVMEGGLKNLAVYEPNQVKSAIGNIGTFARDNNDIRYAVSLKNLDPDSPIVPTEGGNPDGSMGVMPERVNGKPIRMLIGMHNDLIPERDNEKLSKPVSFGANHILNRVLNDPKRMPGGAEELLEKIARTAQRTAQNYNAIYKDGNKFILYDGKNSLVVSPGKDEMSIVTMYTQENPSRRYGNPVWVGRAPKVAEFLTPLRGIEVIAEGERVGRKPVPVQTKRVYTPSNILESAAQTVETPREPRGKLTLKKPQYSLRTVQPVDIESAQNIPQGAFDVEPTATRDNLIYLLQDKQIDLKRVIEGIRQTGRDISDRWNAYLKEELFHGRSAARVKQFTDVELQPLLRKMDSAQVSLDEMDQYLLARHAKEANDYIRSINPDPAANAGMTDQQADDYMKSLPAPRKAALERLAKEVDDITKKTRDLMVDYGLEKPETIDTWEKTYKHYVPLFREETEGSPISIGRGYNIRGRTVGQRMGSSKKVVDVLSNIAMQRERTIVRGEKNRVGNALYGLVLQNPNKGFWAVINPEKTNKTVLTRELIDLGIDPDMVENLVSRPTRKVIDKKTGLVTQQVSPMWKNAGNIFITRINGEDRIIGFNLNDERAMRMVSTLKNLDAQQQGEAIRMMGTAGDYYRKTIEGVGKGTRFFASVNTQYNPAFGIYNLMRDIGGAALNLQNTPLKGNERKVIADAFTAIKAVYRDLRRKRNGLDADSKWAEIFEDFELQGGKTGYRDMFENAEDRAQQLQKDIQNFGKGGPKKAGKALLDWLSDFNDAIENAVRVSVYKNAMDQGISKERAASLAKNITVNFNRTGAVSRNFQTLFAFFNASVQGTARIAQTLLTSDGKLSTVGKRIVMGGLSLGVIQAVLLAMAGLDEDEVPDFIKDKSFVIPTGDGKYLAIPMPLGYNIIPGFGRRVMEFAMSDDKNIGKAVVNTAQMIIDGFNPLGSATFVQTLTPTVLDPIVALAENKDFTGKPIAREDINSMSPTPGYTRGSQNSFAVTQGLAYAINLLSGGSEFKKGVISPTPDQIEYLIGEVFGGVGREAMKIARGVEAAATGEELATYNIPIAGRLIGNVQQKAAQTTRFYENIKRLNEHQAEIEGRMLKGEDISEYINQNPEASMYQVGDKIYSKISKLRQVKKALQESGAERDSIRNIDDAMLNLMTSLNQLYGEARQ